MYNHYLSFINNKDKFPGNIVFYDAMIYNKKVMIKWDHFTAQNFLLVVFGGGGGIIQKIFYTVNLHTKTTFKCRQRTNYFTGILS